MPPDEPPDLAKARQRIAGERRDKLRVGDQAQQAYADALRAQDAATEPVVRDFLNAAAGRPTVTVKVDRREEIVKKRFGKTQTILRHDTAEGYEVWQHRQRIEGRADMDRSIIILTSGDVLLVTMGKGHPRPEEADPTERLTARMVDWGNRVVWRREGIGRLPFRYLWSDGLKQGYESVEPMRRGGRAADGWGGDNPARVEATTRWFVELLARYLEEGEMQVSGAR